MYSLMKNYKIAGRDVMVTAVRGDNDYYGNPKYSVQVWLMNGENQGHLWSPDIKGYRKRKNDSYTLQAYNLEEDLNSFVKAFEKTIQD